MKNKGMSRFVILLSVIAVIVALLDALDVSVWLSANSWLIIAGVLGIWAIYIDDKD